MLTLLTFVVIGLTLAQPRADFSHTTHVGKQKLACNSCHKVLRGDVTDFPQHASCLSCHRQQFFARERPVPKICSNCHVKATPLDTSRPPFPSFGEKKAPGFVSEFRISFAHDKHEDVDCADCHETKEPEDKPRSLTHAKCFACHNQESELAPLPANCDTCHKSAKTVFAHAVLQQSETDYSQFKHDNRNHARLPCLLCHRRENNSPQPALPGKAAHAPCTGCHAQQFSNPASAICTICHTDAQSGKVKAFPPLRSFDARFDHAKHSGAACATCHRRNRGGVGLSIPARLNAHVTCFSCHTPGAQANGRNISSCSTCHQLGRLVRTSEQARAYRVGFSHARHDATCAACHQVRGQQVSAPLPLNHHAPARAFSCASCHNGQRTFGGDDFSVCTRCHNGPSWRF
ncbi:MAG TPA: cytochrome c3 family protein [Pyrinomonadaceae bacterium]|nr:cytochrome c3 family protein [Pyrinomonadaceae bacterium]